jgi:hypothetical protein
MVKDIKERLKAEEQDEDLVKLQEKVCSLVKMSRGRMSELYDTWDAHNDTYRGLKAPDKEDLKAREMEEPEKMIVPMTFAQVQTFVSFCFLLFTQNKRLFELEPTGAEDFQLQEDCEAILDRDLRKNNYHTVLYQMLLDIARFGICVVRHSWAVEKQVVPVTVAAQEVVLDGISATTPATTSMQSITKYEGNRLQVISPYNFFPDTRFPLSEWQKGSFVADEAEWHINELKRQEQQGIVFGVEHIEKMTKSAYDERGSTRLKAFDTYVKSMKQENNDQIVVVTTMQMELIPHDYKLGPEKMPIKYLIQVANDKRLIRCEPLNYLHDEFITDVGFFSPDARIEIVTSLSDIIAALQEVVSFLVNTRLISVRKGLENNVVVDPNGIDMASLQNRSPWILMKKSAPKLGVDKFLRQLEYRDNTAGHLNDASSIMQIMQMVTGVNENAMGQFHGGRRSATEARAVQSGSASRMRVVATILWHSCFASLGSKLLSNHRQGLSLDFFKKILGNSPEVEARYSLFRPANPQDLVGSSDFFVFDATLESEKGYIAQSLQELVTAMMSNPEVGMMLGVDPGKIIKEILQLRGISNVERFNYDAQPAPAGILSPPTGMAPGNPSGTGGVSPVQGIQALMGASIQGGA